MLFIKTTDVGVDKTIKNINKQEYVQYFLFFFISAIHVL